MRVLFWTQYFWPENFRINQLTAGLQAAGVHGTVLTGKPNYPQGTLYPGYEALSIQRERYFGAEVLRVPLVPRGNGSRFRLSLNYLSFIASGVVVAPLLLKGRRFDLVFVYAPSPLLQALPAVLVAWLKGAPLVVWVQDLWPESLTATQVVRNRWALKAVQLLVRFVYNRADSILVQSQAFREPIARLCGGPQKIRYYPNTAEAVPIEAARPGDSGLLADLRKGFSIVFAGNIGAAQSIETILQAAERLGPWPDVRFFIVGGGRREAWLKQEVQRRGLDNVVLAGLLPPTDMPSVFAAASALLVTLANSPVLAQTIPSKIQAYLAAGRPVLASMNGEGARIVEEAGAGFTCAAEDAPALAEAVHRLYVLTSDERARMGQNGQRYFRAHFDSATRVPELIAHFKDLISRQRNKQ